MEPIKIRILGQLSLELYARFVHLLSFEGKDESFIWLFCDRSEFDIPIGTTFRNIETDDGKFVFSGDAVLKVVTQQWAKKLDEIPRGWTTVCGFQFSAKAIPSIVLSLPKLTDLSLSDQFLIFNV
jgi:hypothetical protein